MRKLTLALAAIGVVGFTLPAVVGAAQAKTVIIKKHHDNGRHLGWQKHKKVVIVRERHRDRHHEFRRHHDARVSLKVKTN
jgi:hypothetical protein